MSEGVAGRNVVVAAHDPNTQGSMRTAEGAGGGNNFPDSLRSLGLGGRLLLAHVRAL